jgi:hypothetical protein
MTDLHEQMADLGTRIVGLEAQLGEVYAELVELMAPLTAFLARYQSEVLRHHWALLAAQREIADARAALGDRRATGPGSGHSPLDDLLARRDPSVEEQYRRVWHPEELALCGEDNPLPPPSAAIKKLYARVVPRVHPALAASPDERRRRAGIINGINAAYLRRDEAALRAAADTYAAQSNLPAVVDEKAVRALRSRAFDLERLVARIEGQSYDIQHGDVARIRAYVCDAEAEGRDFLADLSAQIQGELNRTTAELAGLRSQLSKN